MTAAETAHYVGQDAGFDWAAQEGWSIAAAAQHSQEALDGADAGGTVSKAELAAHLRALLQVRACMPSCCGLAGAAARQAVQPDGRMVISRLQQPWSRLTRFWAGAGAVALVVNSLLIPGCVAPIARHCWALTPTLSCSAGPQSCGLG